MLRPRILSIRTAIAVALPVAVALASCTSFEPEAGPARACWASGGGGYYGGYGGGNYSYNSTTPYPLYGGKDPRCLQDGGWDNGPCDACENQYCCQFRFSCYADGPCWCADKALDKCLNAIPAGDAGGGGSGDDGGSGSGDDGGADASDGASGGAGPEASSPAPSPAVQQCWLTFESTDVTALARVNCQRAYCQTQCGVP